MNRARRVARLLRTARHLRPGQILWRLWYRARPVPRTRAAPAPPRRPLGPGPAQGLRPRCLSGTLAFTFLGETRRFDDAVTWLDPARGKLWTYNLHYFDYLDDIEWQSDGRARSLIDDWIDANEYARGDGWEPYPCSLRIVNWIRWAWREGDVDARTLDSLARQVRWLRRNLEHHILANHLFANYKALTCAGLFFGGPEGEAWSRQGLDGVTRELDTQILPDGGHFERSPMYQATLLNDLLDLIEIGAAVPTLDAAIVDGWRSRVRAMLAWQRTMTHPDGDIAFFNDAAIGIAPRTDALAARAARLGVTPSAGVERPTRHLEPSGYVRASRGEATLIADVAPIGPDHQPGHAHADTLSFELSLGARRVIVNSGTSTYVPGAERDAQRRTRSHSTVEVDDGDSSETWSGFRVGRRARPFDVVLREDEGVVALSGAHDGYRHLPGRVTHRRHWTLEAGRLLVVDELDGRFRTATARFFLHPDVTATIDDDVGRGRLLLADRPVGRWRVDGGRVDLLRSHWHPRFGVDHPNHCLAVTSHSPRLRFELAFGGASDSAATDGTDHTDETVRFDDTDTAGKNPDD